MSRFREELRIVPQPAWVVAWLIYFVLVVVLTVVTIQKFGGNPDMAQWPLAGKVLFAGGIPLLPFALVVLIGYVYGDAKRREMKYVMWTLLAIFIPDGIGIILYFILRDPLPSACPGCRALVPAKFTFCPHCGSSLKPTCPQCGHAVEPVWANCPNCGAKLPARSQSAA